MFFSRRYINTTELFLMNQVTFQITLYVDNDVTGSTLIGMTRAEYNQLTCGTFLGKYATRIMTDLRLLDKKKIVMPNATSFAMNLIFDHEAKAFQRENKDVKISDILKQPSYIALTLQHLDGECDVSDYTDNVTPIPEGDNKGGLQSRFPQQTQNTPHLELLHRLDRLLDNYT